MCARVFFMVLGNKAFSRTRALSLGEPGPKPTEACEEPGQKPCGGPATKAQSFDPVSSKNHNSGLETTPHQNRGGMQVVSTYLRNGCGSDSQNQMPEGSQYHQKGPSRVVPYRVH